MKLQVKRSNVLESGAAKEPSAAQMEYGELAVNYNNGDPAIFVKDNTNNIIRIAGKGNVNSGDTPSGPIPPSTGNKIGDIFFDTTLNSLVYWDGSEWVEIGGEENSAKIYVGTLTEIDTNVPVNERTNGYLWWNTEDGTLYVWYEDPNTSQWVIAVPAVGGGDGDANVTISDNAPSTSNSNPCDLWWSSLYGRLYIYYEDGNSAQWVAATPASAFKDPTATNTLDFPVGPSVDDTYTGPNDIVYVWDGEKWDANADSSDLKYTYPGGEEQTVQERLEQYVSVKDFGAVGDGVADDTVAIQAAVSSGESLLLPQGTYKITSTINAVDLRLTGNDAVIIGFNGPGFSVTNSVCISGHLTFQGFEDSTDREGQVTNYTTSAIYFPVGSTIKYIQIDRGVIFYQCRCGIRSGSDTSDLAVDVTSSVAGPSWIYSSAEECVNPIHLHCVYSDLEIAHGFYKKIHGSGRLVAAISCVMDGQEFDDPIYDLLGNVICHDINIDTVVNRNLTSDSGNNNVECSGIRIMGNSVQFHNIIGKDVTGVQLDCEFIYCKGKYTVVNGITAVNCGTTEGTICIKGLDPRATSGTSVPGGYASIDDVRIIFDRYTYNNNGTDVDLGCTGIAINVPYQVTVGDNVTITGCNKEAVIMNGQDSDNSKFSGTFKIYNQNGADKGVYIKGGFSSCKVQAIISDPLNITGNYAGIRVAEQVTPRGTKASYDFSGSNLKIRTSSNGNYNFLYLSQSDIDLEYVKIENVLININIPSGTPTVSLLRVEQSSGGGGTGSWDELILNNITFIEPLPVGTQIIQRNANVQFARLEADFTFGIQTQTGTRVYPLSFALLPETISNVDVTCIGFKTDGTQARNKRFGGVYTNVGGNATLMANTDYTLVDQNGGTSSVNPNIQPTSNLVRVGVIGDSFNWSIRALINSTTYTP